MTLKWRLVAYLISVMKRMSKFCLYIHIGYEAKVDIRMKFWYKANNSYFIKLKKFMSFSFAYDFSKQSYHFKKNFPSLFVVGVPLSNIVTQISNQEFLIILFVFYIHTFCTYLLHRGLLTSIFSISSMYSIIYIIHFFYLLDFSPYLNYPCLWNYYPFP